MLFAAPLLAGGSVAPTANRCLRSRSMRMNCARIYCTIFVSKDEPSNFANVCGVCREMGSSWASILCMYVKQNGLLNEVTTSLFFDVYMNIYSNEETPPLTN